jgi:hypothetical protein
MKNFNEVALNEDLASVVGKFINTYMWSDIKPMGKIIGTKGKATLILARVVCERDKSVEMEFSVGGFSAHCENNHAQKWLYSVVETQTFEVRISKSFLKRNCIEDSPYNFYDYNF